MFLLLFNKQIHMIAFYIFELQDVIMLNYSFTNQNSTIKHYQQRKINENIISTSFSQAHPPVYFLFFLNGLLVG
jgi:hypothetical protein